MQKLRHGLGVHLPEGITRRLRILERVPFSRWGVGEVSRPRHSERFNTDGIGWTVVRGVLRVKQRPPTLGLTGVISRLLQFAYGPPQDGI